MKRVQVLLPDEEREIFGLEAERAGLSLSAWLRQAGKERLLARQRNPAISTVKELRAFFAACDRRQKGHEPDWKDHLQVIRRSIGSGGTGT